MEKQINDTPKPISVLPLWLHNEERLYRLHESIESYRSFGQQPPIEYIEEEEQLTLWMRWHNIKKYEQNPT